MYFSCSPVVPLATEVGAPTRLAWTHAFEYWVLQYRRSWMATIISGLGTPLLFLIAIGTGLGSLVDSRIPGLGSYGYAGFVAPGLLAWTAMRTAVGESAGPVTGAATWRGIYDAMLAAPLRTRDVFVGHLSWIAAKVTLISGAFMLVAAALGTMHSWLAVFALPATALTGIACAAPVMAFAVRQTGYLFFDVVFRVIVTPLFLFSGTFYPVQQLPEAVRVLTYASPLWQGVALCRGFTLGQVSAESVGGHLIYLVTFGAVCIVAASVSFRRRLER